MSVGEAGPSDASVYLSEHNVQEALADAVTAVLEKRPDDPLLFIGRFMEAWSGSSFGQHGRTGVERRYPNLCKSLLDGRPPQSSRPSSSSEPPLCFSGACEGADQRFGACALQAGHTVAHLMGPRNVPSKECVATQADSLFNVPDALLDDPIITAALEKAVVVRAGIGSRIHGELRDCRRNFLQVRQAEAVICVGYRLRPSETEKTPVLDIGGGTGWAAQWYVDRFQPSGTEDPSGCHLYLWDDSDPGWDRCLVDPATHRRWSRWRGEKWVPLALGEHPPALGSLQMYAGIGATILSAGGEAAIRALYAPRRDGGEEAAALK